MTKKEVLTAKVSAFEVPEASIDVALIDAGITGSETYAKADFDEVELAKAYLYKDLAVNPDFKQGSLSISNSQAGKLLAEANRIFKKNGLLSEYSRRTKISLL